MGYRTLEQKINAGHDFDGTAPTGDVTFANNVESTPAQNAGGLFDFKNTSPILLKQVAIIFGGQSSWSLVLVDTDLTELKIDSGTTETNYLDWDTNLIILMGQKLKLVTTGASTAQRARITAQMSSGH